VDRLLILAGDITPMDIISHLPVLSEEASIPYVFVTSKEGLGQASATKRPTSCVLVCPKNKREKETPSEEEEKEYLEHYNQCLDDVKELDTKILF
jgi:H/ACA ribonucleoprotein complex subunit 2